MVNVVGSGQIAKEFNSRGTLESAIIFASGVADSKCIDEQSYDRERKLLKENLELAKKSSQVFVYFSSCALSAKNYDLNRYYKHKQEMEEIIKNTINHYLILRVPQLFGEIKKHPTLINFLYYSIIEHKEFTVYSDAYRYVISINDLYIIVKELLKQGIKGKTFDVANPYRYKVLDIVNILEELTKIQANYNVVEKKDGYILDLTDIEKVVKSIYDELSFGKSYLYEELLTLVNRRFI